MASYTYGPSDISAIRSALSAGNNTVTLRAGTYRLTSSTTFTFGSNTTLIGSSGTIITGGTFGPMFSASSKSNITIRNCEITHSAPSGNYGSAPWTDYYTMYFSSVTGLYIYNCYIHDGYGDFIICRGCTNIYVHDNTMYYSGHECLYALSCANVNFYNNRCRTRENSACRLSGTHTTGASIHHNDIDGKKYGSSDSCTGPGIQIDTTQYGTELKDIRIYNNTIHDTKGAGIWAQSDNTPALAHNIYIYDNIFTNCGSGTAIHQRAGINSFQIHNLYIERNTFTNCGSSGSKCALRLIYRAASGAAQPSYKYTIYFRHNIGQQTVIKEHTISVKPYYTTNASDSHLTYNINNHTVITTGTDVTTPDGGATPTPVPGPIDTTQPSVSLITNATTLTRGNSTTLSWRADNCTHAILNTYVGGTLTAAVELPLASSTSSSGTYSVTPTTTSVYTLVGYYNKVSPTRSASSSTQITVTDPVIVNPSISSITTSKTTIYTNEMVKININGAKDYTYANLAVEQYTGNTSNIDILTNLINGNGNATITTAFSLTGTKSIILTLKNGGIVKTFTPAAPITVIAAPTPATPSLTLNASFTEIIYGDEISLNWTCTNATSLMVNGLPQSSITTGSISVSPGSDAVDKTISNSYVYTAIATNSSYGLTSTTTKTVTITVNPYIPKVPLVRLRTDTQLVDIDQPATISWVAENTNSLFVNYDIGAVDPVSGSIQVYPTTETTYVFSAIGDDGANNTSITIDVLAEDIMSQFVSTPTTVYPGDPVTLAWASRFGKYGNIDNDIGAVNPASGVYTIYPAVSSDYVFTVSGSMGVDSKTIHVSVLDALPSGSMSVQYSVDKPLISSGELTTISWTTNGVDAMACGQDIGFVDVPSGSIQVYPYYTENYEFIAVNGVDSLVYEVPIYVIGEDYELIQAVIPTYTQDYIDITGRRIYVSGGQSTSDTQYTWDIDTNASMRPNPNDDMITFAYDENGYYMITLTSVDHDGNITKQTVRATVINT